MIGSLPPAGFITPTFGNRIANDSRADAETAPESVRGDRVGQARPAEQLSDEELAQVRALQQRDREVRAHEMAHVAVGGELVLRGAQFDHETGPDGVRYAVGGDVLIDTSPGRTPEETIEKAERIRATALAPADPSPQDLAVASMAIQMALQAQIELAVQQREEAAQEQRDESDDPGASPFAGERMREAYAAISSIAGEVSRGSIDAFA